VPRAKSVKFKVVSRADLIREARELIEEPGTNPEYERGIAELIYWTCGGSKAGLGDEAGDLESIRREIGAGRGGREVVP